jgi:undecaprenol kinase
VGNIQTQATIQTPRSAPDTLRHPFKARNFVQSLGYAREGLQFVFKTERNFRTDLVLGVLATVLGVVLGISTLEWMALAVITGMVLFAETVNTAIEYTIDMITHGEFDSRAKVVKDLAAGACLLTAGTAGLVGLMIFIPHLLP